MERKIIAKHFFCSRCWIWFMETKRMKRKYKKSLKYFIFGKHVWCWVILVFNPKKLYFFPLIWKEWQLNLATKMQLRIVKSHFYKQYFFLPQKLTPTPNFFKWVKFWHNKPTSLTVYWQQNCPILLNMVSLSDIEWQITRNKKRR